MQTIIPPYTSAKRSPPELITSVARRNLPPVHTAANRTAGLTVFAFTHTNRPTAHIRSPSCPA
jgi:hypothetical protein